MAYPLPGTSMPETGFRDACHLQQPQYPYYPSPEDGMMLDSGLDSSYSNMGDDVDFAAALASFQPCDDCTPATKTSIPHHHHPSGRLAGASATLDGHFCCSWVVHDQPCFLCFESAQSLDDHIKNDHAGKDGTYRCLWQDCSKHDTSTQTMGPMNFGNKPKLMRHVHSHTGFKPFPCSFPGCNKGFVTKEQLKNHETTHTKSRKYKCDQCGKAFAVKSALTTHITAVHDEKKIHSCDICGKAFADSSNLSKHKQTHYRDISARKQRSRRGTATNTSTRSSPSMSTPSAEPATPIMSIHHLHHLPLHPSLMPPPAAPKLPASNFFTDIPATYCPMTTTSTTSSPPPESFDPSCYCCDQQCPPPQGPATPCDSPGDCDLDGFCDLPECLGQVQPSGTISSPDTSTLGCSCDDPPLSPQQIEQLRNFQASTQWDGYVHAGGHHRGMAGQFYNVQSS